MEKQYRKNDLNIIKDNNELLLVYSAKNLVDSEIKLSTQENILMKYNIEGLQNLKEVNLTKIEKLELLYRLVIIMQDELQNYEYSIAPENIYLDVDNNIKILEKKIKIEDYSDKKLREIKALSGYLLLKGKNYEELLDVDNKDLQKDSELQKIYALKDMKIIQEEIEGMLKKEKGSFREKKVVVNKKTYRNLQKNKGLYRIALVITVIIIIILSGYIMPFKNKEVKLYNAYVQSDYTQMLNVMENVKVSRMTSEEKYIASIATIKTQSELNDKQKENILNQINVKTDTDILDYWVYIGQGNFEEANNKGIAVNNADMQIYALLLMIDEVQNDESLEATERKELVDDYTAQVESLNKQKEEISGEANV